MGPADTNPDLLHSPAISWPALYEQESPPELIFDSDDAQQIPTGALLFKYALEEQPEFFLYAVGKAIRGDRLDTTQYPGELANVLQHLDTALRIKTIDCITGVDPSTQVRLESDGDYQLVTQKYGRNSIEAKLRTLRTYLIRLMIDRYDGDDTTDSHGCETV